MFLAALLRTVFTLRSPHFIALLIRSALITLICFAIFLIFIFAILHFTHFTTTGSETFLDIFAGIGATVLSWFLLPTVLPATASFFQETIATKIETHDYPQTQITQRKGRRLQDITEELKFLFLLIGLNLLCLPLYLIPVINVFTYYTLNAYLIGREFFETIAARQMGRKAARMLRQQYRLPTLLGGLAMVLIANMPVANLIAPFIGITIMVHLFHLIPEQKKP